MSLKSIPVAVRTGSRNAGLGVLAALGVFALTNAAEAQTLSSGVAARQAAIGCTGANALGNLACTGDSAGGSADSTTKADVGEDGEVKKRQKNKRDQRAAQRDGTTGLNAGDSKGLFSIGNVSGFAAFDFESVDKRTTNLTAGYDTDKRGGTIGVDMSFDKFLIGAAFVFGKTDGLYKNSGGSFTNKSYGGYVYGSYYPIENAYIDAIVGYSGRENNLNRTLLITGAGGAFRTGNAAGSSGGNEFKAGLSGGYDFNAGAITFGPRAGLNYMRTRSGAFAEQGTTGLELAFDTQTVESIQGSIGVHGSMAISTSFAVLVPQVSADIIHEFSNNQQRFTARLVQDPLQATIPFQNDNPDRDFLGLGFGMVMVLPNGISPYVTYRALVGDSIQFTQTVSAGVRFEF